MIAEVRDTPMTTAELDSGEWEQFGVDWEESSLRVDTWSSHAARVGPILQLMGFEILGQADEKIYLDSLESLLRERANGRKAIFAKGEDLQDIKGLEECRFFAHGEIPMIRRISLWDSKRRFRTVRNDVYVKFV